MRRRFFAVFALALTVILAQPVQAAVDHHIVSRVEVVCRGNGRVIRREYRRQKKMEAVLNYLRLAKYAGLPEAPPPAGADGLHVTVYLLPGGNHRYDLRDWQYFSRDGSPWELVEMPEGLVYLLQHLPSDG